MHSNRILWPQSYTRVIWIIIQTKYFACRFIWRGKISLQLKSMFNRKWRFSKTCLIAISTENQFLFTEPKSQNHLKSADWLTQPCQLSFFLQRITVNDFLSICDTRQELQPELLNEIRKNDWNFFHVNVWILVLFSHLNQNHKFQVHVAFTHTVDTWCTQSGRFVDEWVWFGIYWNTFVIQFFTSWWRTRRLR